MRVHAGSLTERILDWLDIEGGWWATSAIYDRFSDTNPNHVQRTLQRMQNHGVVESRPMNTTAFSPEHEWRAV